MKYGGESHENNVIAFNEWDAYEPHQMPCFNEIEMLVSETLNYLGAYYRFGEHLEINGKIFHDIRSPKTPLCYLSWYSADCDLANIWYTNPIDYCI